MNHAKTTPVDSSWKSLYRIGSLAALISFFLVPLQAAIYIIWTPPADHQIAEWFTLFQKNWLVGLLSLDLLLIIDYVLLIPIMLSLYLLLRKISPSFMLIALALFFISVVANFASNTAFEMLSLSSLYSLAATEAQKTIILGAGQAMIATYKGSAFHLNYVLGQLTGIIISVVMFKSPKFSKVTAWSGILGNAIGFGLYVPVVGIYISLLSVIGLWIWYILIARSLFRISKA